MDIKDPDIRKQAKDDNQDNDKINDKKNDRITKLDEQLLQLIPEIEKKEMPDALW